MPDPQTHDRNDLIQPNAENRYEVTAADLPLSCPMPGMYQWNSHPKVYLPIHETGEEKCPYCGAVYVLKDAKPGDLEVARRGRRQSVR
ncbi:hypothetical protein CAI21_07950 [Alkalilimnicola ehrlichii]|uniref:Zinc finger CHCC-type domain-containing protein n=1 Tax=Alkalilimnicola ehrlichii TaxID=351052 RepID=A0A3E0WZ60_9GAMM|nr:zinc-finger domain-containing protein [Alkalilimnicola ehrlichii]RFA30123.1 hypothetical protein CAI21_07950 [Alkalilimnicola ehrlichii]RFA37471.1 hypothetical protein CAL65_09300 [Alkalilimnicola ehrlichii]